MTDLGHCRCHISYGAVGGSRSPPLKYQIRLVSHIALLFVFSACSTLMAATLQRLFCSIFYLFSIFSPASVLVIFAERLHSVFLALSIVLFFFLGVCVDLSSSPLMSRLLRLIISQQMLSHFLLLLPHSLSCTLFTWAGHKMTLLQCKFV